MFDSVDALSTYKKNKTVLFVFNPCYFYLEATTWLAIYIYLCVRSKFYIENFAQDLYDKVKLSDTQTITLHRYTDTQTVINMLTNKHTLLKASQMTQFIFNILYFRFRPLDVLRLFLSLLYIFFTEPLVARGAAASFLKKVLKYALLTLNLKSLF